MYDELFKYLFEIVSFSNQPKRDRMLLKKAGVQLDTALFPIVVRVGMSKNIGVVELADQLGRDHSTVSRQVDKLQAIGLVVSDAAQSDRRVREIQLSNSGRKLLAKIVTARRLLMHKALADWDDVALNELRNSLQRLAASLNHFKDS
jgi:DNA-binding MarR family transcriptional regulator